VLPGETLNWLVVALERIWTKPGMLPTTIVALL